MPIFEYIRVDCHHRFERLVTAGRQPSCPVCAGSRLDKQLSVFAVSSPPSSGPTAPAPCGTCGDARGPGSCGLD